MTEAAETDAPQLDAKTQAWIDEKEKREYGPQTAEDYARIEAAHQAVKDRAAAGKDSQLADTLAAQQSLDLGSAPKQAPGLVDKFLVPPFTTLDTRAGYWRSRRDDWGSLGMRSEVGRDGNLTTLPGDPLIYDRKAAKEKELGRTLTTAEFMTEHYDRETAGLSEGSMASGTSVFDPVLCEAIYQWFSPEEAVVLDPFAGGCVRGVVASVKGRHYTGVELRPEQIADNRAQADAIVGPAATAAGFQWGRANPMPRWVEGDATKQDALDLPTAADLVFTCPPYADLEVYSDNPADLSNMPYAQFRLGLKAAMEQSAARLKPDRFAVWVVGEARDKKTGYSYGLVADTVRAGHFAGLGLYNEAILLGPVGTAMLRAQKQLRASLKLVRTHQHVLVFVKGDGKRAAKACGVSDLDM